jgi:Fe-S-cluster-containing dehydrogenase component
MDIFSGEINNFEPEPCLQCADPDCLRACPVEGAMYVDAETGARVVNEDVCTGCRLCIEACSQRNETPRIRFDRGRSVAMKCDLCGGEPQCVRWCPNGSLRYVLLHEFNELGRCYSLNFNEAYTKDFGPSFEPFQGNKRTFNRVYPRKE